MLWWRRTRRTWALAIGVLLGREYAADTFSSGKPDLYAVVMLRCLELTSAEVGRVAVVTPQSWMLLQSFTTLRAGLEVRPDESAHNSGLNDGLMRSTSIETMAHLGANAFQEISGEVVQVTLLTVRRNPPSADHEIRAIRAVGHASPDSKAQLLRARDRGVATYSCIQASFLRIPGCPLAYWMPTYLVHLFESDRRFGSILKTKQGAVTGDNQRFLRFVWEFADGCHDVY